MGLYISLEKVLVLVALILVATVALSHASSLVGSQESAASLYHVWPCLREALRSRIKVEHVVPSPIIAQLYSKPMTAKLSVGSDVIIVEFNYTVIYQGSPPGSLNVSIVRGAPDVVSNPPFTAIKPVLGYTLSSDSTDNIIVLLEVPVLNVSSHGARRIALVLYNETLYEAHRYVLSQTMLTLQVGDVTVLSIPVKPYTEVVFMVKFSYLNLEV